MSTFGIAVLLAWIAGFVDAMGYIVLLHAFPAHMSGNTVAAGLHLGTGEFSRIARRAFPIPMFVIGVFTGALMGKAMQRKQLRRRFAPSFILELVLLGIFIVLTCELKTPALATGIRAYGFIALLAVAMGLQNATLRCARGMTVRTTFITGMLVSMAERAASYVTWTFDLGKTQSDPAALRLRARRRQEGKRALKYGLLWCGMLTGAVCGAALETVWGTIALLLPVCGLIAVIIQDFLQPISEQ